MIYPTGEKWMQVPMDKTMSQNEITDIVQTLNEETLQRLLVSALVESRARRMSIVEAAVNLWPGDLQVFSENWAAAIASYHEALTELHAAESLSDEVRLDRARARFYAISGHFWTTVAEIAGMPRECFPAEMSESYGYASGRFVKAENV